MGVDARRHGAGGTASGQSRGNLWLYAFACNRVARIFYEHHDFRIVERGFEPTWQLEDIKYFWSAVNQPLRLRPRSLRPAPERPQHRPT